MGRQWGPGARGVRVGSEGHCGYLGKLRNEANWTDRGGRYGRNDEYRRHGRRLVGRRVGTFFAEAAETVEGAVERALGGVETVLQTGEGAAILPEGAGEGSLRFII